MGARSRNRSCLYRVEEMKTVLLALLFLTGCASWHCPNAPKMVATFSVGDHVAFTKGYTVWDAHSEPQSFWVDRGDTGVVTDILYYETFIVYHVLLDKSGKREYMVAHAHEGIVGGIEHHDLVAVVYPDPALAPGRK